MTNFYAVHRLNLCIRLVSRREFKQVGKHWLSIMT